MMITVLIILAVVFLAMQTLSLNRLKVGNMRQNLLANGVFSAMIAVVFIIALLIQKLPVSPTTLLFGALFGLDFVITVSVYYYAMQIGPLSYTTFFFSASMVVPVIVGLFIWNEHLTLPTGIGIVMFMAAFYFISVLGGEKGGKINTKWIILCLICWLFNGLLSVISKQHQLILAGDGYQQMMTVSFTSAAIFAMAAWGILRIKDGKEACAGDFAIIKSGILPIIGTALGSGAGNVIMTYLSSRMPSSIQYPLVLGCIVVSVSLYSIIFLKERPSKPGIIGIIIGLAAIVVINL